MTPAKMHSVCIIFPGWITKIRGGAEWQSYLISEELVKMNFQVTVITEKPNTHIINEAFLNERIKYVYYKNSRSKVFSFFKALILIYKQKSQFFYTRADNRIFRSACGYICKLSGRKMIYALAGDDELEYGKFRCSKDERIAVKIFRFFDYGVVNFLTRKSEHNANLIIAQTYHQKEQLKLVKGLDSILIRNSLVLDCYPKYDMSKENIVLWIGNFRPIKQPEVFISIANSFVNRNIKFVMIGVQGKYIYTDLPKNLEMKGFLNNSEVVNYLRRSKVLINTSLTEGFSNTFLEAWINNVFVLSLNVNPDNLLNGRLGMCTNGSMHLLSKKLDEIINNKSFDFKSVGDSFKDIISEFDLNSNIVKLISVIDSLKS